MVSRSETARQLLTQGEVMQLPPDEEIVMVSGVQPIRAKKAAYYADPRLAARIMPPPDPAASPTGNPSRRLDGLAASADPAEIAAIIRRQEDAANSGCAASPSCPIMSPS
jgi:type IV secretion system protein VirD4